MKILVADDERLLVKGIKFNLENEGYEVEACYDGEEAVSKAASGNFDLIILDSLHARRSGPFLPSPSLSLLPEVRIRTN